MMVPTGDALSQLLALIIKEAGGELRLSGRGREDLRTLVVAAYNAEKRADIYAEALHETVKELNSMGDAGEAMKARVAQIILEARAVLDLKAKT